MTPLIDRTYRAERDREGDRLPDRGPRPGQGRRHGLGSPRERRDGRDHRPLRARPRRRGRACASATGVDAHDVALVLGSGWVPAADAARRDRRRARRSPTCPASTPPRRRRPRRHDPLGRVGRRPPGRWSSSAAPTSTRAAASRRSCTACAPRPRPGARRRRPHQRLRRAATRAWSPGHAGADQRPHQPHRRPPRSTARPSSTSPTSTRRGCARCAREVDPTLDEGVYVAVPAGRTTRRRPRSRMARRLGGDLVGHVDRARGDRRPRGRRSRCSGISLVTNLAAGITGEPLNHDEVLEAGRAAGHARWARCSPRSSAGSESAPVTGPPSRRTAPPTGRSQRVARALDRPTRTPDPGRARTSAAATPATPRELADRFGAAARVRHRRAARRPRRRPEPDEPRRRQPRGRRARGLPAPRTAAGRPVVIGYDARHKSDVLRARHRRGARPAPGCDALRAAPAAADAGARVRGPPPRRRGRRHGHRVAQPAAGQRLQGLPRRRRADRPAGRRRDRGRDRTPSAPLASVPRGDDWETARRRRARRLPRRGSPSLPRPGRAARPARRLHAAARRRAATSCARRSPAPASRTPRRRGRAGRARPGLPDRRVPQPGGARRDRPRAVAAASARRTPTS